MPTISVHVDDATFKLVGQIAERDDRSKSWVVTNALKRQLAHERRMVEEIESALAELDSGKAELIEHDELMRDMRELAKKLDQQ